MDRESLIVRLTAVFRDVFDDDTLQLFSEMNSEAIEGWDSLGHIRLVVSTEQAFGVQFNSEEIANLGNVGEFVDLLAGKLANEPLHSE